jgi:hypothetical protein
MAAGYDLLDPFFAGLNLIAGFFDPCEVDSPCKLEPLVEIWRRLSFQDRYVRRHGSNLDAGTQKRDLRFYNEGS